MSYIKIIIFCLCMTFLHNSSVFAEKIYTEIGETGKNGELLFYYFPLEKARLFIDDNIIYIEADTNASSLCYLPNEYVPLEEEIIFDSATETFSVFSRIPKNDEHIEGNNINIGNIHIPGMNNITEGNVHHSGTGNISIGNTYIGGDNNFSRNNTTYGGSNNTNIGNTHYAGSDNTAVGNTYEGSSNNIRIGETTHGADGKISYNQTYSANQKPTKKTVHDNSGSSGVFLLCFFVVIIFIFSWILKSNHKNNFPKSQTNQIQESSPVSDNTLANADIHTSTPTPVSIHSHSSSPTSSLTPASIRTFTSSTPPTHESIPVLHHAPAPVCIASPLSPTEAPKSTPPRNTRLSSIPQKEYTHSTSKTPIKKPKVYPAGTFVQVAFTKKYRKLYDYYIGDNHDVRTGDFVEVFVHSKGLLIKKIARVERISKKGEVSLHARSNIVQKSYFITTWKAAEKFNSNS